MGTLPLFQADFSFVDVFHSRVCADFTMTHLKNMSIITRYTIIWFDNNLALRITTFYVVADSKG